MLELKKKQLEKMKVECGKAEMEMRIYEAETNIERLKQNITIQENRVIELDLEIEQLKTKEG